MKWNYSDVPRLFGMLILNDGLHLNDKGYQLWKKVLAPFLEADWVGY